VEIVVLFILSKQIYQLRGFCCFTFIIKQLL